jgi:hypothetical protein
MPEGQIAGQMEVCAEENPKYMELEEVLSV